MNQFVHLHVHTEYSLLDGCARIDVLAQKAKQLNMPALAITDHGVMYGIVDFYKACKKYDVKPILGCEMYICQDMDEKSKEYRGYAHLVLLAKDKIGYKNLMHLCSVGYTQGFYHKPRIDYKTLFQYKEGLICLSACLAGDIPSLLLKSNEQGAKEIALNLKREFGDDFYIEIQDHGIMEQKQVNPKLIKLANECDIKLVLTNDVHYVQKDDALSQDVLMCIQTRNFLDDPNRISFSTQEFYLKSHDEMQALFPDLHEAVQNTIEISEKCNVELDFGTYHMPVFDLPQEVDHNMYLNDKVYNGLEKRYGEISDKIKQRADYEISVITSMGFTDYFLITWDFIKFAKDRGIMVGPGRGSAAGSIVAYALRITDIDPIEYNLLFERFLNPERISMPDIDIDFCIERRGEVIDYVVNKYGVQNVAQIITFGTLGAKQAIQDVARVMKHPFGEAVRISKMIPNMLKMTIKKALEQNEKFNLEYNNNEDMRSLIDMSMKLEGIPRHASTHAAGVVISKKPIMEYVPLQINPKDGSTITQFDMVTLEELGLLKMDFLGLRNLTVIRDTITMVKERRDIDLIIDNIGFDDPDVYELISSGDTDGVFQLESAGMRRLMQQLKPSNLGDIMVGISLFRPGPMDSIPTYIDVKNNPHKVKYDHPSLEKTLSETYGCIVYQEQVMEIVRDMAGYSLGRSDMVRRAMSKKKTDVMDKERDIFIFGDEKMGVEGAVKRGIDQKIAKTVFDKMTDFAQYAFNKSHACAYAAIAYQTAYLKVHYKIEFLTALLNSFIGSPDKTAAYVQYCKKSKIQVLQPDINRSYQRFSEEGDGIRFGFSAIRAVGEKASEELVNIRKQDEFVDFMDFLERTQGIINKKALEGLILAGCFDSFGHRRSSLVYIHEMALKQVSEESKNTATGQISLFDTGLDIGIEKKIDIPVLDEYETRTLLSLEKQTTGSYLSGHPLSEFEKEIGDQKDNTFKILSAQTDHSAMTYYEGKTVEMIGILYDVKRRATKDKRSYALCQFEDLFSIIDVIVFSGPLAKYEDILFDDNIVRLRGKVDVKEDESPKIVMESITEIRKMQNEFYDKKLYVKLPVEYGESMDKLINVLKKYPGDRTVTVHIEATKQTVQASGSYKVTYTKYLIKNLQEAFGMHNVKLV